MDEKILPSPQMLMKLKSGLYILVSKQRLSSRETQAWELWRRRILQNFIVPLLVFKTASFSPEIKCNERGLGSKEGTLYGGPWGGELVLHPQRGLGHSLES